MKRKLLLTACIIGLSTIYLSARQITPDEALSRLTPTEMNRIKAAMPHAQLQLKSTGYDTAGNAAYYVFSAGDRTLFASADDVAAPLLGYVVSPDFNINDMPPAMSWWLSETPVRLPGLLQTEPNHTQLPAPLIPNHLSHRSSRPLGIRAHLIMTCVLKRTDKPHTQGASPHRPRR